MAASRKPSGNGPAVVEREPRKPLFPWLRGALGERMLQWAGRKTQRQQQINPFAPYVPPADIFGETKAKLAFDEATQGFQDVLTWAASAWTTSAFAEGVVFLGYPYLAELAQRPEYRAISEVIATEATREWIELKSAGGEDKAEKIKQINDDMAHFKVKSVAQKAVLQDGFFGRAHIYIDTGYTDEPAELKQDLGDGRNEASKAKFKKGTLKAFRNVEPMWAYPATYQANDPLKEDWYRPETWLVMSKEVHRSRFLTLISREVSDILKPAYAFGGLSMSQMAKPYIDNWLRVRQSVADLVHSFSVQGLKINMQSLLSPEGTEEVDKRINFFVTARDNKGVFLLDASAEEEFFNVVTPLGTLDALQAQSQEHMSAVSRIPIVKLLGVQPAGLNASSEGEIRTFYDWIHASPQENLLRDPITTMLNFIQLNRYGEVDPDITFDFVDLWQLDELAKAGLEKTKSDIDEENIAAGIVAPEEARQRLAKDKDSIYGGLDLDKTPAPIPPAQQSMGGPGEPGASGEGPSSAGPQNGPEAGGGKVQQLRPVSNSLSSGLVSRAERFGSPATGGFKGDGGMLGKEPKEAVGYEHPARGVDHCADCHYFVPPFACDVVDGRIEPDAWCEDFRIKTAVEPAPAR